MTTPLFPQCNSSRLKRSHSRGLKERFVKITGKRAYRCIRCGWRGILERGEREPDKTEIKETPGFVIPFVMRRKK
ncbi:MAG: hypothetical protein FJ139_09150 [Deltaproteobacteria bacterium]|nr:hypothetical protein [Deltaproteobacteria bacterium]